MVPLDSHKDAQQVPLAGWVVAGRASWDTELHGEVADSDGKHMHVVAWA